MLKHEFICYCCTTRENYVVKLPLGYLYQDNHVILNLWCVAILTFGVQIQDENQGEVNYSVNSQKSCCRKHMQIKNKVFKLK